MPTKKEDLRSSRGQRKPRQTKPKYVFKVVKPTATPYKQSTSRDDAVLNLIKQQHQQNALQQQQLLSSFVSQLGSLSNKKQTNPDFITREGKQVFFTPTGERIYSQMEGPIGSIATEYAPGKYVSSILSDRESRLREKYFKEYGTYPPPHEHFGEVYPQESASPRKSKIPVPTTSTTAGSTTKHEVFSGSSEPPPLFTPTVETVKGRISDIEASQQRIKELKEKIGGRTA